MHPSNCISSLIRFQLCCNFFTFRIDFLSLLAAMLILHCIRILRFDVIAALSFSDNAFRQISRVPFGRKPNLPSGK